MALPKNGHHVHSDGYRSERGEPDRERMLMEMADEVEQIPQIESVWVETDPAGPYMECECEQPDSVIDAIEDEARSWNCAVTDTGSDWIEVRPE